MRIVINILIFMLVLSFTSNTLCADDKYLIKQIALSGVSDKENIDAINNITKQYAGKRLSFTQMQNIRKKIENLYKKKGRLYVKVIIPKQDISNKILHIVIIQPKVDNINIYGNKYYSSNFIANNFSIKKGEKLEYKKMIKSLLLLNEYSDLNVKSFLKKGANFGTTDITLQVKDKKPFHFNTSVDNLGSKDTSKYRVSTNIFYGNLLREGDETSIDTIFGTTSNTKLIRGNYTLSFGENHTKVNIGYLYANYIASGDFSILNMKGNTKIYTLGINRPLIRSIKNKLDISFNYHNKKFKNFLLGSLSSKDYINTISSNLVWNTQRIFDSTSINISASKGFSGDGTFGSRLNEDINFLRYNLDARYIRYINDKSNIQLSLISQYSKDKLPVAEMISIGGFHSIRGFEPSVKLGDSGIIGSLDWRYNPHINNKWLRKSLQIDLFIDHGIAYVNNPVPGEEKTVKLTGAGFAIGASIKKKYYANLTVGFPVFNSVNMDNNRVHLYFVIGARFF